MVEYKVLITTDSGKYGGKDGKRKESYKGSRDEKESSCNYRRSKEGS